MNVVNPATPQADPSPHRARGGERLVLTAEELAELLGISRAHLFRLDSRGLLPRALRLGRSKRWDRNTVSRWLEAGAPPRDRWEASQVGPRRNNAQPSRSH